MTVSSCLDIVSDRLGSSVSADLCSNMLLDRFDFVNCSLGILRSFSRNLVSTVLSNIYSLPSCHPNSKETEPLSHENM